MVQTTIRLPEELYNKIKKQSKQRGISINSYIITILYNKEKEGVTDESSNFTSSGGTG